MAGRFFYLTWELRIRKAVMKNKILFIVFATVIPLGIIPALHAQSDYEVVQSFKQKYHQTQEDIKNSQSLGELNEVYNRINSLKDEYASHRELLNKSLYPDDFDKSFEKLVNVYNTRKKDFTQIDILQTQVIGLKEQLDSLNRYNEELINRVEFLEKSKSDKSLSELKKTVKELRLSLQKRDDMIISMIDSLLPQPLRQGELGAHEKQQIYNKINENNVLLNIKLSLNDNARFIEITKLYPEDIDGIKEQQEDFARLWRSIGPRMVEIYSEKDTESNYLKEIDEAFTQWKDVLDQVIWGSINSEFSKFNIRLSRFSSGQSFTHVVFSFINDEIKNAGVKSADVSISTYVDFADSAWYGHIKPEWVPSLIEYKMLTEAQEDSIEKKISEWSGKINPEKINFLYIIFAVILIGAILILFFRKYFGPSTQSEPDEV
jgi:hypothetical protein